jgi:hypothetical protein
MMLHKRLQLLLRQLQDRLLCRLLLLLQIMRRKSNAVLLLRQWHLDDD